MTGLRAVGEFMIDPRGRPLGGMVKDQSVFTDEITHDRIRTDGRPSPQFREQLRRIPDLRNAVTVALLWIQTIAIIVVTVQVNTWWLWIVAFLLMGRAHAQFSSLMHEAAHRCLFRNKRLNDEVGRWLLGWPVFISTDGYRRAHMAHHREEFGPEEPDVPLYAGYPITRDSFRRKLFRDATGRTGLMLLRAQLRGLKSPELRVRRTMQKMIFVQVVLASVSIALGHPLAYLILWVLPWFTIWRVINRLRAIAEHGGLRADADRSNTTHSVRQHLLARFFLVPYNIGFHIAHHVDPAIPFRSLPAYHRAMRDSGYVTSAYEYPNYRGLWRALSSRNA